MDYKSFCSEFTKLLYNIAKREDKDKIFEIEKFQKQVTNELINLESEEYGLKNAIFSEFDFEYRAEAEVDLQKAIESFIEFINQKKKNNKIVNAKLKSMILEVVVKFYDTYRGIEEKEKGLLEKLKQELDKI